VRNCSPFPREDEPHLRASPPSPVGGWFRRSLGKSIAYSHAPETTTMNDSFAALGLSPETLKGIDAAGFEAPTPIQTQAIPILLAGEDLVAQAQTGTGKTAAFALPLVERLDPEAARPQALVLCPTRELAVQVSEAVYSLGRQRGFRVLPVYGGQPIDRQLRALRQGVQIVVGTPGRLLDHLRRKTLDLAGVATVVLDEADEMLDMGFIEEIELILDELPEERQIALFSATIPEPIARLARKYLRDPRRVTIEATPQTVPQIRQCYYEVLPAHKLDALTRILDMETPGPTIIFCRTKREADELGEHLRGRGFVAESLHGDMGQAERDRAMRRFRQGQTDLLVATDVAARGLDIETVTHVINYDIPWDVEGYTHRIGRTGRAGREGDAITLVSPRERRQLKLIERATGTRIAPVRLPTAADIAARRRELFRESVVGAVSGGGLDEFLIMVEELAGEHEPSEVAAAALKLLWTERQPGASGTLTAQEMEAGDGTRPEPGMARLFLTAGRRDGLRPTDLVGAIANEAGIPGREIGAIDILDHCAFVEVPLGVADKVVRALSRATLRGRRVKVEKAPEGVNPLQAVEAFPPAAPPRPRRPGPPKGSRPPRPPRPPRGERHPGAFKKRKGW
jgi:ATP-dependent RNA helicase DeaD